MDNFSGTFVMVITFMHYISFFELDFLSINHHPLSAHTLCLTSLFELKKEEIRVSKLGSGLTIALMHDSSDGRIIYTNQYPSVRQTRVPSTDQLAAQRRPPQPSFIHRLLEVNGSVQLLKRAQRVATIDRR